MSLSHNHICYTNESILKVYAHARFTYGWYKIDYFAVVLADDLRYFGYLFHKLNWLNVVYSYFHYDMIIICTLMDDCGCFWMFALIISINDAFKVNAPTIYAHLFETEKMRKKRRENWRIYFYFFSKWNKTNDFGIS